MSSIKYVVVQAAGKGTRMGHLTANKPKALISISGKPIIFSLMERFPKAHFIIIGDYKIDILRKYLKNFSKVSYEIVDSSMIKGDGSCRGINKAISLIPNDQPFLLAWCDLLFTNKDIFKSLNFDKSNYMGITDSFPCRWKFEHSKLSEDRTEKKGVAGIFIFKNKYEISDVPMWGEFCRYLLEKDVKFKEYLLDGVREIGTYDAYLAYKQSNINSRPFNRVIIGNGIVKKIPKNKQGRDLAKLEKSWYKVTANNKWNFIPKINSYNPFVMKKINGKELFREKLSMNKKRILLAGLVQNLKTIHSAKDPIEKDFYNNNSEAIILKTKRRLDSIINLIPYADDKFITINGRRCINFYKKWNLVQDLVEKYLHCKEYSLIHGDCTFSNTIVCSGNAYLIDPRGYYGNVKLFGDIDYDWAKLYYSLFGNYDQFNLKNFELKFLKKNISLSIKSNEWEDLEKDFFALTGANQHKIRIFHAIIWLSLASYAWDDYDSICGAFYNGVYYLQDHYEKTFRKSS
jgi:GTP:adenosylcobinamide-phosphate guanylyltransferase